MRAYSHAVLGAGSWLAFSKLNDMAPTATAATLALLGSLLPDIDHPKSFVGRRLWFISLPLSRLFGHRGITHSLFAVGAGMGFVAAALSWEQHLAQAFAVGYLSHLAGDWCTSAGIPLLWPWPRRFMAPLTFRTGGLAEHLLDIVLLGWIAWAAFGDQG
jgi:inner membrane protein